MLDGVIRANTANAMSATNGRACTTSATGTTTLRLGQVLGTALTVASLGRPMR
jgi:hypothetical protein